MKALSVVSILFLIFFGNFSNKSVEFKKDSFIFTKYDIIDENEKKHQPNRESNLLYKGEKKALIIANGNYQKQTLWSNISSHNDIAIIKDALEAKGFNEVNIRVEKDLTSKRFIDVFEDFTKNLSLGDVVYVHISSHGQQIYDDNNDEKDGYDEAIVPVDAPSNYKQKEYEGDKHIRDEKLGELFDAIRKKIGAEGNLFAVLDACHSGTGTRGLTKHRGSTEPFQPDNYTVKTEEKVDVIKNFGLLKNESDLGTAVYFYGSSANQLNYEHKISDGQYVGSLSFSVAKALKEADNNTTYQGLFDQVKRTMSVIATRQKPQVEGILNQKILGGQIVDKKNYFNITKYISNSDGTYGRLNGGKLQGLNAGTQLALYDIDGLDKTPKATATIIYADILTSEILLNKKISKKDAEASWVVVTGKNYGDMNVTVSINIQQKELQKKLLSAIDTLGFISLDTESPDLIIESGNQYTDGDLIQIFTKDDMLFWKEEQNRRTNVSEQDIISEIEHYSRVNFVRRLEMEDEKMDMTFEFIPISVKQLGTRTIVDKEISIDTKKNSDDVIVFKEGDYTYVKVKNNSKKTLYYSLIDIQPDNKINVLIPNSQGTSNDYYLKPGNSKKHQIRFGPPYGNEVFKLIASKEPINLGPILRSNGTSRGAPNDNPNPFEVIFRNTFQQNEIGSRGGGNTQSVPSGSVNIQTVLFEITQK